MSCNDNDYVCRPETSITRSDELPEGNLAGIYYILVCGPPGGGTPLNGLYRYVPRNRVWFLDVLDP